MKLVFASSEAAPFSQSGGLGDVAGSLPKAIAKLGCETAVFTPLYASVTPYWREKMTFVTHFNIRLGWRNQYCGVFLMRSDDVDWYFLDNEYYFKRDRPYGYEDDGERFAFFSKAVVAAILELELQPNIVHANDWHTAMVPVYLATVYRENPTLSRVRTVFTIHNIGYQGKMDPYVLGSLFGLDAGLLPLLEYDGCINLVKGGIVCADAVTTVSPTYADELSDPFYAEGLQHIIANNRGKLLGILNGIDTAFYNPSTDAALSARFSPKAIAGKKKCKAALQSELGLPQTPDTPLIAMITRLTPPKGLDLVRGCFDRLLQKDVQFVILGEGEQEYKEYFEAMRVARPDRVATWYGFNSDLARRIYAGADLFLMPSRSEPCGLAQMIAMRYATIPVVHQVGGLADTVFDCRLGEGNGYCFAGYNDTELLDAVDAALALYRGAPENWKALRRHAAECDFSWDGPAGQYVALYERLLSGEPVRE